MRQAEPPPPRRAHLARPAARQAALQQQARRRAPLQFQTLAGAHRYVDDGRIEIDNDPAEWALRSVTVRQDRSRPVIDALELWLGARLETMSQNGKLAEPIRYALSRWEGLARYLDDGRSELDSDAVERAIRPPALNRKTASSLDHTAAENTGRGSLRW